MSVAELQNVGGLIIGANNVQTDQSFEAVNPANGETLSGKFSIASVEHVKAACELARAAFTSFKDLDASLRADFLDAIGQNILALGDELLDRAHQETGLPMGRLTGERGRTIGQLGLFAAELRDGAYMGIRIDSALPDRAPMPRVDLRQMQKAVGPVAVFGASNFPLAFSVAGGDTASALAAGCPVVVKGHDAHPGTSALVAGAIRDAVKSCGLHEGVFSHVSGQSYDIGTALVANPHIQAVGFTGSRAGGLALMDVAAKRPCPIPVYAEMSAINPVIILPNALKGGAADLGAAFAGSLTMGAGQFCTNPGLILAIDGPDLDAFLDAAQTALTGAPLQTMLTPNIQSTYEKGVKGLDKSSSLTTRVNNACETHAAGAALFEGASESLGTDAAISEEVFGASSIVLRCKDEAALARAVDLVEGQLTITLHLSDGSDDMDIARALLPTLEEKAGRILVNGWPTGVEVCHAMVHGGPFPATSDGRTTSVGSLAINRFLRPICYQNMPEGLLPNALRGDGASHALRRLDGTWRTGTTGA